MRSFRFSIGGLMAVIVLIAIASAGLAHPTGAWAGTISLLTGAMIYLAIVGAICRTGAERVWWVGFAAFGWFYRRPFWGYDQYPTHTLLEMLARLIGVPIPVNQDFGDVDEPSRAFFQIGHSLWALVAAVTGGFLASVLFSARSPVSDVTADGHRPQPPASPRWPWWVKPSVIVVLGLALALSIAVVCAPWDPGLWAGATYLLTWFLLGLTALGSLFASGRRREFWLGATFLGVGFMLVIFNRPYNFDSREQKVFLPTVELLEAIRPSVEDLAAGLTGRPESIAAKNARIEIALNEVVPTRFTEATTLEKLIQHVQQSTRRPDGKVIPIYVDPIGLRAEGKWTFSIVTGMNFEGVPLRTSLELGLKQLDLAFVVRGGLLVISSITSIENQSTIPYDDPYQIVGHCLLALVAAGLGGAAAPSVCDRAPRRRGAAT